MFDLRFFVEAFTMFVIMDPPGVIPLFLAYTSGRTPAERRRIAWQAAVTACCLIVVFAVFGQVILSYLHVEVAAMQIAGGLLLLLVALELLRGTTAEPQSGTVRSNVNVALVPLGTPLLAGPGAIVATIVFAQQAGNKHGGILALGLAIAAVHLVLWLFMRFSVSIIRVIKENGVELVTRIAGLLLSALAVQLIINAIRSLTASG